MPKLNPDHTRKLESPITVAEIRKAVSLMNTWKSPGYDGFPVGYYKEYMGNLAPVLVKAYQEAFEIGHMPPTFNEALISLIPKKDRYITDPSNFKPISLLNLDFKMLTKVLVLRLQQVSPNIIHPNQAGFMKNTSSSDNMRKLIHLMWLAQSKNVPIAATSLDAEKAFDEVEWSFLFSALSHFGFGPYFSQWAKTLYKEPKAAVITNGVISPIFGLSRGTCQGCSLSPLLFIICLETLAVRIRNNGKIKGVEGGGQEHKLLLYADDILAVVTDPEASLPHFLWDGKRARIKLSKLCAPKEKGGLGLPDPRLYEISFEMAKLAKYWKRTDNKPDWMEIENELCLPFSPKEQLSQ